MPRSPQDLDDEFLVVWDGFTFHPPWKAHSEPELRAFLLDRAREGYSFPINPVWPVRDPGWYEILKALQKPGESEQNLTAWFNDPTVLERIEKLHAAHPAGFQPTAPPPELTSKGSMLGGKMRSTLLAVNLLQAKDDLDTLEMAMYVEAEVRGEINARWKRVRSALKMQLLLKRVEKAQGSFTSAAPEPAEPLE